MNQNVRAFSVGLIIGGIVSALFISISVGVFAILIGITLHFVAATKAKS